MTGPGTMPTAIVKITQMASAIPVPTGMSTRPVAGGAATATPPAPSEEAAADEAEDEDEDEDDDEASGASMGEYIRIPTRR